MKTFIKKSLTEGLPEMRIAYISLHWPRPATSSIGKKISQQISAWIAAGHEVKFFSHMHTYEKMGELINGSNFVYSVQKSMLGTIRTEINRAKAASRLVRSVADYCPDIIYLRWGMFVYPVQRLFRIAPVAVEVNTYDVREHQLLGPAQNLYNRLTRGIILGSAAGLVFASRELMELPDFSKYHRPGIVITNSVDLGSTPFYPAPNNTPPHLVFIGTPGMAWHGVDKLVNLAKAFPDLVIDIVGMDKIEGVNRLPGNLILHGFLQGADYETVLANADAAIGTLSLHVKGMEEAATLKIRDCSARGIPCILPYLDTDFSDVGSSLFLRIPNTEDNILTHGQAIHDFLFQARGHRVTRGMIENRIDSHIKEEQRLDFFQKMISTRG
jgi:hypothetical protein